jgi:parallel beta-helix repeat protein
MQRACALGFSFVLLFLLFISLCSVPTGVRAGSGTIIVPDDYSTIQTAINAANVGDTVFVRNAVYHENVVVNKYLSLIGEDPETTVIDGGTGDCAVLIVADNVTVASFTLRSSRHFESGPTHTSIVLSSVNNCTISGNIITGSDHGIGLDASSENNIFQNNVTTNGWAIVLNSAKGNSIHDNYIADNGIAVWLADSSDENRIFGNNITRTTGVQVAGSSGNIITANNFTGNLPGITLGGSNTTISANTFVNDGIDGAGDSGTYGNTVENNTVNGKPLVYLEGVSDRTVEDAGQVIIVNSTHIRIENLNISSTIYGAELIMADNVEMTGNNMSSNKIYGVGVLLVGTSNSNLTGNILDGIRIRASQGNNVAGNIITGNNLRVSSSVNNSIVGNNITAGGGIELENSDTNKIEKNSLTSNEYGIYLAGSSNNSMRQNHLESNVQYGVMLRDSSNYNDLAENNITSGGNGIAILSSSTNNITGNTVGDNDGNGIWLDASTGNILTGNTMANNDYNFGVTGDTFSDFINNIDTSNSVNGKPIYYLIGQRYQTITDGGYVAAINSTDMRIQNMDLRNNIQGLLFAYTSNSSIQNVTVTSCAYGIWLESCPNVSISESNVVANQGDGISLTSSQGSNLHDSKISMNQGFGIVLASSSTNLTDNNITENNHGGIWFKGSMNNIVSGNNITENSGDGIFSPNSESYTIVENNISGNSAVGLHLQDSSDNSVVGNYISHNGQGILLHSSSGNDILGNDIKDNVDGITLFFKSLDNSLEKNNITANTEYGIQLSTYSDDNRIFHNKFMGNGIQASVEGSGGNMWNDGYPSGGNYWGDYAGVDVMRGQYQNETGSDGIGDTPYVIDANNTDHYPSMGIFSEFNVTLPYGITESVSVVSNSTVSNLKLAWWLSSPNDGIQPGQPLILFTAPGESGNVGFCMMMIPRTVLNSSSYVVLVDSHPVDATQLSISNDTCVYLYFTYTLSSHEVIVTIPEFSSLTLLLFIISTLLAVIIYKRKRV